MKLIALTNWYAGRAQVTIQWSHAFYFKGDGPAPNRLVTLDLPGLSEMSGSAVSSWLAQHGAGGEALVSPSRREISEFEPSHWKYTVLEDFLVADNYNQFYWYVSQHFAVEEIVAFEAKHLPRAWEASKALEGVSPDDHLARDRALAKIEDLFMRTHATAYGGMNRVAVERHQAQAGRDEELVAAFDAAKRTELDDWVALIRKLQTHPVRHNVVARLGRHLADLSHDSEALIRNVVTLHETKAVADAILQCPQFWAPIQPWLTLPPTEAGGTFDLSSAVEVVAPMHWIVFESRRVGPIVPGRRALCIPAPNSRAKATYVRADRRLLFQIAERGGTMTKHGCTLTVDVRGPSIRPLLTEVEELIVLANLAPERALAKIADLELRDEHPVFGAARRASTDHRWAHIFADLLIELRTGLDADVARRLVG